MARGGNSVVICEKPSQARNVSRAVGGRFGRVLAARGHLLDLREPQEIRPEWKVWSAELLHPGGPYPLKARKGAAKQLAEITSALRSADRAVIATDCDREGHLIGMEILRHAGFRGEALRAIFSAEDPETLRAAFDSLRPAAEFAGLEWAGEARRNADQICNLTLTRAATVRLAPGQGKAVGIGRVRTPTLSIVCLREREILNFTPEERYVVEALTETRAGTFTARCRNRPGPAGEGRNGEPLARQAEAEAVRQAAAGWSGPLKAERTRRRQAPPMPQDLAELQKQAGRLWRWPAAKTLETAQRLYADLQLITYPRADCRAWPENLAADAEAMRPAAFQAARALAGGTFPDSPGETVIRKGAARSCPFSDKRLEGSAHHAIMPNPAAGLAAGAAKADADSAKLFAVVLRRFLACTAPDRQYQRLELSYAVETAAGAARFQARGETDEDSGWTVFERPARKPDGDDDSGETGPLPPARDGEAVRCGGAEVKKRWTRPPARYDEGGLIAAMKEAWRFLPEGDRRDRLKDAGGIGTPATRDRVAETLARQGQMRREKGRWMPTEAGMALWETLSRAAPQLTDPGLTAEWEREFDLIERAGGGDWMKTVDRMAQAAAEAAAALQAEPEGSLAGLGGRDTIKGGRRAAGNRGEGGRKMEDSARPPSDKQTALLARLSQERGLDPPDAGEMTAAQVSDAIAKLLGKPKAGGGGAGAPTPRSLAFLKKLAEERGAEVTDEDTASQTACSAAIDRLKAMPRPGDGS